jgi:NTP pyrophosphatase (non-canonical NTP hydrolase)
VNLNLQMSYDDAMEISHGADSMTLEQLVVAYTRFNAIADNTPNWMPGDGGTDVVHDSEKHRAGKSIGWQRAMHAAMGLSTEAGEVLDPFKKELFGKQRPLRPEQLVEELGDIMFYVIQMIRALNELGLQVEFKDLLKDNVKKLANRYCEKFGR